MDVTLLLHLELVDGEHAWWAESDDVPGFTAAAPTLAELRERAHAALHDLLGAEVAIRERLAV